MSKRMVTLGCVLMFILVISRFKERQQQTAVAQTYPFQSGFPRFEPGGTIAFSSPTVVDINNDGQLEILTADGSGCVWAWNHTGAKLPNYPLQTAGSCQGQPRISGPLAVGDVDGDGKLEIAAGTRGSGVNPGQRGKIFLWNGDGSLVSGWPKEMAWNIEFGSGLPEVLTVAMANLTGDERLEIIAGTSNNSSNGGDPYVDPTHNLYAFQAGGTVLPGFPTQHRRAGIWGFVGTADLDKDGYAEIITGRDHSYAYIYDPQGNDWPNWPIKTDVDLNDPEGKLMEFTRDAPSIADIDNDGQYEIVIAGKVRDRRQNWEVTNSGVLVLLPNGQRKPGWEIAQLGGAPLSDEYPPTQAPALADLTGDGNLEIVVALFDGIIRAYRVDGTLLWQYDFAAGTQLFASEPIIGDITGDGHVDIVFGTYSPDNSANDHMGVYALDRYGNLLEGFPLPLNYETGANKHGIRAAPTLTDLDNDCDVELVAGSQAGVVYVWDLPALYNPARMPWPTARHDFQRTGFVETAVTPSLLMQTSITSEPIWHAYLPLIAYQANPHCHP